MKRAVRMGYLSLEVLDLDIFYFFTTNWLMFSS